MARTRTVCPFLKKPCIACAQFRGRHYYMCYAPNNADHLSEPKPIKLKRSHDFEKPPVLTRSPNWLTNIEDLIERGEV